MRPLRLAAARPVSEVLTDIVGNMQDIVRCEIRLARAEMSERLSGARKPLLVLLAGALAGLLSAWFLLLGAYAALSHLIAPWLAAVCIGMAVGVTALILLRSAAAGLRERVPGPGREAKENVEWLNRQTK